MGRPRDPPPHLQRIARRIRGLDASVVQLVGWPGTGKRRLLAALPQALEETAVTVTAADADSDTGVASEAAYLIAEASDPARWCRWSRHLGPQQTLIVASERFEPNRWSEESLSPAVVGPSELLLQSREAADLLPRTREAPGALSEERSSAWLRWCGGWLYPLELVLVSRSRPELPFTARSVPGLEDFLRFRVLGSLPPGPKSLLLEVARALARDGSDGERELREGLDAEVDSWTELLDRRGLLIRTEEGGLRLPVPLQIHLEQEARRAPTPPTDEDGSGSSLVSIVRSDRSTVGFEVRLLGVAEVRRVLTSGEPESLRWRFRRVLEVLALLASSPDFACPRDRLVAAIWPDHSSTRPDSNLHPTISHLRRMLRDASHPGRSVVRLQQAVYSLAPSLDWHVDVVHFEGLAVDASSGSAEVRALEEAAELYRGSFLEGFHSPWIDDRREELHRSYARVLEALGSAYAADSRWHDAEDAFRRLLIYDSLREEIHVLIMRLYARRGRPDLVRRQYELLCRLLLENLETQPMDETSREYQRLVGWSR